MKRYETMTKEEIIDFLSYKGERYAEFEKHCISHEPDCDDCKYADGFESCREQWLYEEVR